MVELFLDVILLVLCYLSGVICLCFFFDGM